MNSVYQVAQVSKQAYHKRNLGSTFEASRINRLIARVDQERSEQPGCGLEKLYDQIKPDWLGRDRFISLLMKLGYGVRKKRNFARTTICGSYRYPNLIEGLLVWDKNRLWQTDITFFQIGNKYYYLVFIIDVYTKVIRGYQVSDHMRAEANIAALRMAIENQNIPPGLIHHSDGGKQFIETRYKRIAQGKGMIFSMGKKGQENAYAERVNGTIKNEYLQYKIIHSFTKLKQEVKKAVEHYNQKRIHRHLPGKKTPIEFEKELLFLETQSRPKVIVYTEGNPKIREASSHPDFNPETEPQVHVCPMVINH